jgi:hypothetical protein
MPPIYRETHLDAGPDIVWDAVRDFGSVHERVAPGFVVDAKLEVLLPRSGQVVQARPSLR